MFMLFLLFLPFLILTRMRRGRKRVSRRKWMIQMDVVVLYIMTITAITLIPVALALPLC